MSIIRFEPNTPVEIALKFDGGQEVPSTIPGAPNQLRYSLCGGDIAYFPLHVGELIEKAGIKKLDLFSVCKRQQGKTVRWEVKRVGDAATEALPAKLPTAIDATPLERQLTDSYNQVQQRKATTPSRIVPPAAATAPVPQMPKEPTPQNNPIPSGHTHASLRMAASLIAGIDAVKLAEQYAASKGIPVKPLVVEFLAEDLRAIGATIYIQDSKDSSQLAAAVARNGQVSGGASWPRQQ